MNHLQQRQKAKGLIVLVDIKHSHSYNWKPYFLNISIFGSNFQHFSTFVSNQNDHVLNQTRNSECGMAHDTLVDLVFVGPVNIPILSLLPAPMHNAGCMMYYHLPPYHLSLPPYHLSWSNIYENSQHTEV